jgi:uncharacterized protein YbjT (DUF2867 family)
MLKPRILVTGATGKTGRVVAVELLRAGFPVRALVHRDDSRSAWLKSQGAETAVAEMSDVERIVEALQDVQRAYYCPPFDPYMIQGAAAFTVAARESGVEHIVSLTQWLASPSHPALTTRQLWLADRLFAMTPGIGHTTVQPGFFAENYLALIGLAANFGVLPWIYGDSRNAPPSNEDIARVAVAALLSPDQHAGRSYRPTGPALLGAQDMVAAIGAAVGRTVRVAPMPSRLFLRAMWSMGFPLELISGVRYYLDDHRRGAFELGAPTTDVLEVTGRPPEDFETIARRYAVMPTNRRGARTLMHQLVRLVVAPLRPGFDLDRYDRELRRPFPSIPQFAPESEVWRREHDIGAERNRTMPPARQKLA